MESSLHPQLIMSNPREAAGFLSRLEEFSANDPALAAEIWWKDNPQERADLLQWAYTEADNILRSNMPTVTEISQRLSGGAATIADCVAAQEKW
jgi:hypothetical protein